MEDYVKDLSGDDLKMSFLKSKLSNHVCGILANHLTFKDCMETLKQQYGDNVKATTYKINEFIGWCLQQSARIYQTNKLAYDVARLSGQTAWLVNPSGMACKCFPNKKTGCNEAGHEANDHCKKHCEFKTYKEDSD